MRKLLFCGAAAAVTLSAGALLSAVYANRHPDSWVGSCVVGVYKVMSDCSFGGCVKHGTSCNEQQTGSVVPASTDQPGCCDELCEPQAHPNSQDAKLMEEDLRRLFGMEKHTCGSEPVCRPVAEPEGVVLKQLPIPLQVGGNEESSGDMPPIPDVQPIPVQVPPAVPEPTPSTPYMPPCPEDQVKIRPMPRACEGESSCVGHSLVSMWMGMARSIFPVLNAAPPPFTGSGATEESEMIGPGSPSKCQEDPHSSEQYPGCPFMGPCPSGKGVGSPTAPENLRRPHREGGEQNIAPAPNGENLPQSKHESNWQMVPGAAVWENWMHSTGASQPESALPSLRPNVDTTEFRSSDARADEFEPKQY